VLGIIFQNLPQVPWRYCFIQQLCHFRSSPEQSGPCPSPFLSQQPLKVQTWPRFLLAVSAALVDAAVPSKPLFCSPPSASATPSAPPPCPESSTCLRLGCKTGHHLFRNRLISARDRTRPQGPGDASPLWICCREERLVVRHTHRTDTPVSALLRF
jgi:hypothetical protein